MKTKLVSLIAILCLMTILPLAAQDAPPIMEAAHNGVVHFLQLSEEQVAAWDILYTDHKTAQQPIQESLRDVQDQLHALLEEENPDLETIGGLIVLRRDLGQDLMQIHRDYNEAFMALLEEEQIQKLNFIRRADEVQPLIPAFKAFELVRRH